FAQWESWLQSNPWGYGINWTRTIEVALRAVNWGWAFSLLADAPGWTRARRARLGCSLWEHATYVERNLEVGIGEAQVAVG
ncbi:hypothetical protein MYX04_15400, partial [Nitrospiraceae bacterium AH_259_D15_M11_P09]|nr:hypothetical protein [Nitrospiraceae bacterium AH_259_D15_M11_P09]